MLEYFVHLDKDDPPDDLVLAVAEIPDTVSRQRLNLVDLPQNWRDPAAPASLSPFGDEFAQAGERCLLIVPSVLSPRENNYLVNPAHPDFKKIILRKAEPLKYDMRMFSKQPRRRH